MKSHWKTSIAGVMIGWREILSYIGCIILILLYTNTFVLWAVVQRNVPSYLCSWLPLATTIGVVSLFFLFYLKQGNRPTRYQVLLFVAGVVCLVIALALPDSRYPVKRIHVAQYFLLSLLVRYALAIRLEGRLLVCFTFLVTWMFGVHEELLQGVHPLRTYGLRDLLVNGLAALGGALIGGAAGLYTTGTQGLGAVLTKSKPGWWLVPAFLFMAVAAYLLPLVFFRRELLPWWILLPILVWLLVYVLLYPDQRQQKGIIYGCNVLGIQAALLLLYPVLINVAMVEFN